ncbi:GNAT family N-acetyltransferase [Streptomyces seoulensis]|uniref:GNAT family N-acetyltransferase n=1 Tax=Streptomyces seoulensis TaxID=73044 RepID=UPI0033AB733E
MPALSERSVVQVTVADPRVRPLLRELGEEYSARYGKDAHAELARYPDEEFTAPHGGVLLLLLEGGEPVAGGAFRRYDAGTAELKRIWTHSGHRRRGLAREVVAELEREALARGYRRIYLTTGPRQPEARALYLNTGYRPLFDTEAGVEGAEALRALTAARLAENLPRVDSVTVSPDVLTGLLARLTGRTPDGTR